MIRNPILPGFNPDPSICRDGDDYYIATSTFEWFPGVQIHHSRDLVHWRLLTHALRETRLLDLRGVPSSGGVWAPALSFYDGLFYLCYTVVHQHEAATKDTPNYLITAPAIEGPWSDPVFVNASGFDPSLFHDDDGKKYWLNMVWDHRPERHPFHGIALQEYDAEKQQLVGTPEIVFEGSSIRLTEGPHIYKRNGWYYLLTAEGGTEYEHAVTLARSRGLPDRRRTELRTRRSDNEAACAICADACLLKVSNIVRTQWLTMCRGKGKMALPTRRDWIIRLRRLCFVASLRSAIL